MSDNKKYYYLKLKDNFFDREEIKVIESMQSGHEYVNLLLKLYLKSLNTNGELLLNNKKPFTVGVICALTGHTKEVIKSAMQIFCDYGLMEVSENRAFKLIIEKEDANFQLKNLNYLVECCIYKISNKKTNMCYIGSTNRPVFIRWQEHLNSKGDSKFHYALNSSEITDWSFKIIKTTDVTGKNLLHWEQYFINLYDSINNGYNTLNAI